MRRFVTTLAAVGLLIAGMPTLAPPAVGHGSGEAAGEEKDDHHANGGHAPANIEEMRESHRMHKHEHDFEAMEEMSPEQRARVMTLMHEIGVAMPPMDSQRGRHVFLEKGCIACHSVNGVGGDLGPTLNAADMPRPMNAFEFAARMWRGAQAMTALQEDMLGEAISLSGQDLADLVAFTHDAEEQSRLTDDQIPDRFRAIIEGD